MTKQALQRVISVLLSVVLCICTFAAPVYAANYGSKDKIEEEESKKAESEKKEAQFIKQIEELQKELDVVNDRVDALNVKIADHNRVIQEYQKEVKTLQQEIDKATKRQAELDAQISETYALLGDRLYATYVAGETSALEILLGASDFESFLTRLELVRRIAEHDASLVSDLQADIDELNKTVEKLSADKTAVEEKQAAEKAASDAIVADRAEELKARSLQESKQRRIQEMLWSQQETTEKIKASLERAKEEYDRQQAADMESGSGSLSGGGSATGKYPVSSKGMIHPLQYPNVIISAGWYGYPGHKGIDFITAGATGNTYGKEIRAAADGEVKTAESHYSWGNNVYINHGEGVYTRYAHCSKMIVGKGEKVKQGQVIGYVGNSGNVSPTPTGPNDTRGAHLHFEVWVNGTRVNPAGWLP